MGSMTDERRKEMEEEMMRFEQEIACPADEKPPGEPVKPLPPPPGPPKIGKQDDKVDDAKKEKPSPTSAAPAPADRAASVPKNILPEVLSKPPPPPPPPAPAEIIPQQRAVAPQTVPPGTVPGSVALPPSVQGPRILPQGPPGSGAIQFIPHQLQRLPRPPPPPPRPNLIPMRGPPGFHGPPAPMPFAMHGPMFPPVQHHPMPLPSMGMPLPVPHGFCPPPPPGMGMGPMSLGPINVPSQPFVPTSVPMSYQDLSSKKEESATVKSTVKSGPEIASAPAVYAAPPMKSLSDKVAETSSATAVNGQAVTSTAAVSSGVHQMEEPKSAKTAEESVSAATAPTSTVTEPAATKKEKKKKKIIRNAGGQTWEDNSLIDWDTDDFRIFCGDLGNDVTDEVLIRSFSKYPSFIKAKVIRDKRTNKTKGYGFVSFKDPQDFIKAMREMNGRYVGSRPIKLRKSTWRDRNIEIVRKKQKEKEKLGLL